MEIVTNEVKAIQSLSESQAQPVTLQQSILPAGGLRPNPNKIRHVEVADLPEEVSVLAQPAHHSTPVKEVDNTNTIKDLELLLAKNPRVVVTTRLLVKVLLTNPEFEDTDDSADNDTRNVPISNGKDLNFYSPFKLAKDDNEAPGFLRKPLFDLIKYLTSCNSTPFVLMDTSKKDVDSIVAGLDHGVSSILFKTFGTDDLVTNLEGDDDDIDADDEDEDTEDKVVPCLIASDFVDIDSWKSVSFSETGVLNVNYTVSLGVHSLEIYDAESQFKAVAKLKKMLISCVEKLEATTLTISLAVVVDNKMLVSPNILETIDDFTQTEDDSDPEFTFTTHEDVMNLARDKDDAVNSLEYESFGIWGESDELYPELNDVPRLIRPSEFMFITTVSENINTIGETEEEN